jgi:hypothetical protein
MLQRIQFVSGLLRKHYKMLTLVTAAAPALLLAGTGAWAQASSTSPEDNGPVRLMFTIPVPPAATNTTGGMYGFDISFVD